MAWARLALLPAADNEYALTKLAEVFGYKRLVDEDIQIRVQDGVQQTVTEKFQTHDETDVPQRKPARFVRINKIIKTETDDTDFLKPAFLSDPDMRLPVSEGSYCFAKPLPLMPMARLLPLLFNSLSQTRSHHSLDYRLLLRRIAQGKALQGLPIKQQQRWPQRLQIIVDSSQRLEPYWADFEFIVQQLQTLLGKEAVQALRFDEDTLGSSESYCLSWPGTDHDQWQIWQRPPADMSILILSDLGFGDSRTEIAWQRQLGGLQQHAGSVLTLSPAYQTSADLRFCQQFKPNALNDHSPLPRHPISTGFSINPPSEEMIDNILIWLAPLPLIDAGLLRRLRVEMQWGDSRLEKLIWNHHAMRDRGLGIGLQQQFLERYQQLFQQRYADSEDARLFWKIVADHHAGAYQGLQQLEALKLSLFEQSENPAMCEYFQRLCATGMQSHNDPDQQYALRMQCRTVLASLPESVWNSRLKALVYPVFAVAFEDEIRTGLWPEKLPSGFNLDHLRWVVGDSSGTEKKQTWQIVQLDDQGQIKCEPCSLDNKRVVNIVKVEVAKEFPPRLILSDSTEPMNQLLQNAMTVRLLENQQTIIETRGLKLELEAILRPDWASRIWHDAAGLWSRIAWLNKEQDVFWQPSKTEENGSWVWSRPFGEDDYGLYVDLSIKRVTQRFRWIQPGSFLMGSPADELEREWNGLENGKGTENQHKVTLTKGFWLTDTAVSQAFWKAVMGNNPSKFKDNSNNPVEQVSWDDIQLFIDKLNDLFPGLSARLPSEVQWEYACRASTTTPFSFGVNINAEQVNYNANYPYAERKKGRYREQTVPVKSLPANAWGLYEMHGNVWEWCADSWQQQVLAEPVIDPLMISSEVGAGRVLRGGSWVSDGRDARSADRSGRMPDYRAGSTGFRFALGQAEFKSGSGGASKAQKVATDVGMASRVAEQRQSVPTSVAASEFASNTVSRIKKLFAKGAKKKK